MKIHADDLIKFARTLEETAISTLSGSSTFTVTVTDKGMNYTPSSTGRPRKQAYNYIKRVCDQFSETQSYRRSDYSFTAHASYVLALIDRYVNNSADEEFEIPDFAGSSEVPYDEMDSNIVSLAKAINAIPGIYSVSSCGGHHDNTPHQLPWGRWEVMFQLDLTDEDSPTSEAWLSLEALAYSISKCFRRGDGELSIGAWSPAPDLNGFGESITFTLKGKDVDPDVLAKFLISFLDVEPG